jgi:hypothetical protein
MLKLDYLLMRYKRLRFSVETLTLINQKYFNNNDNGTKMSAAANKDNDNDDILYYHCYWLCNRKAELKVYTDFGNILHMCKRCYEIYDPAHRLKTEEIDGARLGGTKS